MILRKKNNFLNFFIRVPPNDFFARPQKFFFLINFDFEKKKVLRWSRFESLIKLKIAKHLFKRILTFWF
jgi:hypothetical protein